MGAVETKTTSDSIINCDSAIKKTEAIELDISNALAEADEDKERLDKAEKIWNEGRMLDVLCETASKIHIGEDLIIKSMFLSAAAARIRNASGIHIAVSGDKGTGKTHSAQTVASLLPKDTVDMSSFSDKALLYHKFKPGTIVFIDDQNLSPDIQEIIKCSTSDWNTPVKRRTVDKGAAQTIESSPRITYWICKVEKNGDDQILDRQLSLWSDESTEQKTNVIDSMLENAALIEISDNLENEKKLCRTMWDFVPKDVNVIIPFAKKIRCNPEAQGILRTLKTFLDMIRAAALLNAQHRGKDADGNIISEIEDFDTANNIMKPITHDESGSQNNKLLTSEKKVIDYLSKQESGLITYSQIQKAIGMNSSALSTALNGRPDRPNSNGLYKIYSSLSEIDFSKSNEYDESARTRERAVKWDKQAYENETFGSKGFWLDLN